MRRNMPQIIKTLGHMGKEIYSVGEKLTAFRELIREYLTPFAETVISDKITLLPKVTGEV